MVSDSTPPTKVMAQKCLDVGALPNDTILVSMKPVGSLLIILELRSVPCSHRSMTDPRQPILHSRAVCSADFARWYPRMVLHGSILD